MEELIRILESSVKRYGTQKVLTLGHLLNIVKLSKKVQIQKSEQLEEFLEEVERENYFEPENFGDRN